MKTPPHRIAVVALVLLVLAGMGAGWWEHRLPPAAQPTSGMPELAPQREQTSKTQAEQLEAARTHAPPVQDSGRQCELDMAKQRRQRWQVLGGKTDAESRLTQALMTPTLDGAAQQVTTMSLLDALAEVAPEDADIAWYRASNCPKYRHCDREQAIGRVLELEPDNLAGWLWALNEAVNRNADEASLQEILARAGEAKHYDMRDGESFVRIYQAIKDIPLPTSCRSESQQRFWKSYAGSEVSQMSADMAAITAMAVTMAEISPLNGVRRICQQEGDRELAPSRVKSCKAISAKLADGSSLIDQFVGLRIMISLTQGEEAAPWRERYRRVRWLHQESREEGNSFNRDAFLRRMTEGEIATMRRQLQARKRWPPPANWLPDDEAARSQIQTGRTPPPKAR